MGQSKEIDKIDTSKANKGLYDKGNIQPVVEFINDNYIIRKPIQDTAKISILHVDPERYAYPPTMDDLYLDLKQHDINVSEADLYKILNSHNHIPPFDPIVEYFDSIRKTYKGQSHIDILCQHIVAREWDDKPKGYYTERMAKLIRKWMVACVACWYGKKMEEMNDVALGIIAAEGGIGKTHLMNFIVPVAIKHFLTTASSENAGNFDIEDAFTRFMFVYFDELDGLGRRNIETFKKTVSAPLIASKRAREREFTDKKRIGCALFTSNKNEEQGGFMTSEYTPRRFGIIEITDIDRAYSELVEPDQLWSEALMLYEESDFKWKFDREDYEEFDEYNRRFVKQTSAMIFLQNHIEHPVEGEEGEMLTTTEIFNRLESKITGDNRNKIHIQSIGEAMRALGFVRKTYRIPSNDGSTTPKGYCVKFKEEK